MVNGAYRATGSFSTHPEVLVGGSLTTPTSNDTCVNYANGFAQNPTSFAAPELKTSGDTTLYLRITIASGYHGPGTYTGQSTPALSGTLVVGVGDVNGAGYTDTFRSGFASATTLSVTSEGSGTLQFAGWGIGGTDVSGHVT
jgi:hypothetical protein